MINSDAEFETVEDSTTDLPQEQARIETAKTVEAINETARRARGEQTGLPHPFETDQNVGRFLSAATAAADGGGIAGLGGRISRLLLTRLLPSQVAYNQALVNLMHQFDHRDRQQREEIADLQQELAAMTDRAAKDRP